MERREGTAELTDEFVAIRWDDTELSSALVESQARAKTTPRDFFRILGAEIGRRACDQD